MNDIIKQFNEAIEKCVQRNGYITISMATESVNMINTFIPDEISCISDDDNYGFNIECDSFYFNVNNCIDHITYNDYDDEYIFEEENGNVYTICFV